MIVDRFLSYIERIKKGSPESYLIKSGCELNGKMDINGYPCVQKWDSRSRIIFDDGVTMNNVCNSNLAGMLHECRFITMRENSIVHIGASCGLSGVTIVCAKKVVLASHVALGANVTIYDNDMHPLNPYYRRYDNDNHLVAQEVVIDEYAWVGAHSIILKGVHIGKGAVIGAGSVVTKDVPPLTVFAGNPARFVKNIDVSEEQCESLFGSVLM